MIKYIDYFFGRLNWAEESPNEFCVITRKYSAFTIPSIDFVVIKEGMEVPDNLSIRIDAFMFRLEIQANNAKNFIKIDKSLFFKIFPISNTTKLTRFHNLSAKHFNNQIERFLKLQSFA